MGKRGRPSKKKRSFSSIRKQNKRKKENFDDDEEKKSKSLLEKGISLLQKSKTVMGNVLYCDGVGNTVTGIAYKTAATAIIAVVYAKFLDYMYNNFMPGGLVSLGTLGSYTLQACTNVAVRSIIPFFNYLCNPYVKLLEDARFWFASVNTVIISAFATPFLTEAVSEVITFSPNKEALQKSLIASAKNVDKLVCYVAEKLYKFVEGKDASCDIKNKKSDSPQLFKTLSSELRLFDNSIKF